MLDPAFQFAWDLRWLWWIWPDGGMLAYVSNCGAGRLCRLLFFDADWSSLHPSSDSQEARPCKLCMAVCTCISLTTVSHFSCVSSSLAVWPFTHFYKNHSWGDPVVRHASYWKSMFAGHWPAWGLHQSVAPALQSPVVKVILTVMAQHLISLLSASQCWPNN